MLLDKLIGEFDRGLRSLTGVTRTARPYPGANLELEDAALTPEERQHAAALMRVNHVGEVCAQALYQAQKLATRSEKLKQAFAVAAEEEEDHLAWTASRIEALGGRPSLLNPLWYAGSLAIGFVAGRMGDRVSLGFMAETERQVEHHLDSHLESLPVGDAASRAVVEQMRTDEMKHARSAMEAGGVELPFPLTAAMRAMSKVMTRTAYYL
ncbi:2-polyprenyl-3-methyl-6-methoxy-1,4-benzoquinone monooxygenase [Robbsia sp. Bb-Pol-6]|uniref:3-demethoxyubiquinol 3-hydroxylase n=1 Tax=Robbsia betulipollinis TaxID=2981849 RepID=A0ABT3ZQX0_9BURK|nr:2-polyprenyl-3-methyl-6-methoxy-1,4-benzoquinone monooxygenase [Robbsia betulipollinis]MCY0388956.1 2-polyprenyl-3-methyl-6-methoxy-1,4-benzoquinone monooxygenase [Robbsia betulipollinis]